MAERPITYVRFSTAAAGAGGTAEWQASRDPLAAFARTAGEGRLEPGSTLLIENPDRMRLAPGEAVAALRSLLDAGFSIVVQGRALARGDAASMHLFVAGLASARDAADKNSLRAAAAHRRRKGR